MFLKGSNYIACVKVDGKILKDDAAGVVHLPFGSEFSILIKNLNSVRAQVKVSVDGTDATEGTWLIVPANGELELERYIRNGNFDRGNRFKFIERTAQIEANKGVGASDGLIRVEYKSEVVQQVVDQTIIRKHYYDDYFPVPRPYPWPYPRPYPRPWEPWCGDTTWTTGGTSQTVTTSSVNTANSNSTSSLRRSGISGSSAGMRTSRTPTRSLRSSASAVPQRDRMVRSMAMNDVGITVPGSESSQKFVTGEWFKTEATSHIIVLQLRGMVAGKVVKTAVTVKSKAKCETCGTVNKSNMKFCGKCGTSLNLI